ncbi:MAG: S9 family peptidase [Terriglobales bacterium]
MRRLVFLFVLLFSLPAFSQAKHPFTFEDMMKLKRVGEPVPSPDGKWVLFSAVDVDLAANTKTPHIWIVPLNTNNNGATGVSPVQQGSGGQERVLIADQDGDRPRWAPDGKRFAFLSNKDGGSQVWIADFDGAAGAVTGIHELTTIATEAGGELWSPDGKYILFTSDVYPECDGATKEEAACNANKVEAAGKSKVKALIFDRLLYRHWNAFKVGKRSHIFVVAAPPARHELPDSAAETQSTTTVALPRDLTPGDYDAPVFSLGGQDDYAFSPDGQEICYTSNHDKVEAASTNNDLWIVSVNAGTGGTSVAPRNITADNPASDSTPLYSPDGKYIAYRAQQRPGYESDRFRLMLFDRKTGEKKSLAANFDGWVGTIAWDPGSKVIYFGSEKAGESPIYKIGVDDGKIGKIASGYDDDFSVIDGGRTILFTRMAVGSPSQIYVSGTSLLTSKNCVEDRFSPPGLPASSETPDCALPKATALTHLNDGVLSEVAMSPLESFWFPGAKGDKVEGFLVKPPNFDASKKYPVKFLIHGGPQGAWGDDWSYRWNPELFAANGYVVVMINFHGSTGYGQKFIDAINGNWGGAPFEDLMKGLDYAEKTYPFIDKDRECALGASYGGYMANWVLGHTDRFRCIVSHDGMFNTESAWGTTEELWFNNWEFKGTPYSNPAMYEKWSPRNSASNFKTPTLVVHGQLDYRLDVSEGFQLFDTLQVMGVPSKMLYFPDEGHWVLKPQNAQLWYKTVNDWVDRWTKGSSQ